MRSLALLVAVPFLAVATGCGDDSSGGGGGGGGGGSPTGPTCNIPGDNCFVASGGTFTAPDLTAFDAACPGTFAPSGACAVASTVTGYCAVPTAAAQTLIGAPIAGVTLRGYYYTPTYDATSANTDCVGIGGSWTGGGGGGGGTGTESEPNGTIGTADGPYTADATLSGAITASDSDYYAIQNASGVTASVTLSTLLPPSCTTTNDDTVLTVYSATGTTIASNDDTTGYCSQVTVSIPAGTTYYAAVRGFGGSTISAYQLVVNFP